MYISLQSHQKNINIFLKLISQQKLHHALILSGNQGVGKNSFAKYISKFILSHKICNLILQKEINIDEHIDNLIEKDSSLYYLYIQGEFDAIKGIYKDFIGINEIKRIKNFLNLKQDNYYRVIIIDSVDKLNIEASNALLKVLEEPNNDVLFLLICHNYRNILDTIKSRCLNLSFPTLSQEDIKELIKAYDLQNVSDDIIALSRGSFDNVLWYLQEDNKIIYKQLIHLLQGNSKISGFLQSIQAKYNKDSTKYFKMILDILENYVLSSDSDNLALKSKIIQQIMDYRNNIYMLNLDYQSNLYYLIKLTTKLSH